ncbi:MAG: type II toxin-antitoxin system RelE/ParE family toxin [Egibacteraceae bacterium]
MAKVSDEGDDVLDAGTSWLIVRFMRRCDGSMPAKEWFDGLTGKGRGQVLAALAVLDVGLSSGRSPAGRATKLQGSREKLHELRPTKKGGKPPHLRVLFVREGRAIWLAHGFTKRSNDLKARDLAAAETVAREWRAMREGEQQ